MHPEDAVAYEGGTAVLRCSTSESVPAATYAWTLGGVPLDPDVPGTRLSLAPSGNLYIVNVMSSDAGVYQCTAVNERAALGSINSNMATLTVQGTRRHHIKKISRT